MLCMSRLRVGVVLFSISLTGAVTDASAQTAFEAATVRIAAPQSGGGRRSISGDRIALSNTTLLNALAQAYGLISRDQVDGPIWVFTERYDIVAKAPDNTPRDQMLVMLQNLLIGRFKLVLHHETREIPGYALVLGKSRLKVEEAKDPPVKNDWDVNGDRREARGMTMSALAGFVTPMLQQPVLDQTGLAGFYNFAFDPTREETLRGEFASVFTEIEELGLRLDARKLPLDVIVVESGSRVPTDN